MPGLKNSSEFSVSLRRYFSQWAGVFCCILIVCSAAEQYNDCGDGWFQDSLRCYQVHLGKMDWALAQAKCGESKSVLASIHSEQENRLIRSQIIKEKSFWIGLRSTGSLSADLKWSDNSTVEFTDWSKFKPKQSNNQCAFIQEGGKWNLASCNTQLYVNGYICMRPLEVLLATPETANSKGCNPGGYAYNTTCYTLNNEAMTWEEAHRVCQQQNGSLATISSRVTETFIASLPNVHMNVVYWTGLKADNGSYRWPNGTTRTSKLIRIPRGPVDDGCVATTPSVQTWEILQCSNLLPFVCEAERQQELLGGDDLSETPLPSCPSKWTQTQEYCYQLFTTKKTWYSAEYHCQALGGHLPSVHDDLTQIILSSLTKTQKVSQGIWLGLNDESEESSFVWSDGTPFDYSAWSRGEPNSLSISEDCVENAFDIMKPYSDNAQWHDVNCNVLRPYMCAIKRGSPMPTGQVFIKEDNLELECAEKDWMYYRGSCYFMTSDLKSWTSARNACLSKGGDLASVLSEDENNFLIHLQSKTSIKDIWIGLNRRNQEAFTWSDGHLSVYYAWYPTQPKDVDGAEDCVTMKIDHGRWFNSRCFKKLPYLCKAPTGSGEAVAPSYTPLINANCPDGSFGVGNSKKCYHVGGVDKDTKLSWLRAMDVCSQMKNPSTTKGQLASIDSPQEQDIVTSIIESSKTTVWIGLKDFYMEGVYSWIDASESGYSNWEHGQPHIAVIPSKKAVFGSSPSLLQCVEAGNSTSRVGQWRTAECDKRNAYLCQTMKIPPTKTQPIATSVCYEGQSGNACYQIVHQILSWPEAEHTCRQTGMTLASIQSYDESQFLLKLILQSNQQDSFFWIGFAGNRKGTFQWTDGDRFQYSDWETDEPIAYTSDKCVQMNGLTGRWNSVNCFNQKLEFICQAKKASEEDESDVRSRNYSVGEVAAFVLVISSAGLVIAAALVVIIWCYTTVNRKSTITKESKASSIFHLT